MKSRLVLPFWYRLTQVVLEKRPLNGSSSSSWYSDQTGSEELRSKAKLLGENNFANSCYTKLYSVVKFMCKELLNDTDCYLISAICDYFVSVI